MMKRWMSLAPTAMALFACVSTKPIYVEADLMRFNAFDATAVRIPVIEDGMNARIAPPLGAFAQLKSLVIVDGTYRRGSDTDDPRIEEVTAIAPYGKPEAQP